MRCDGEARAMATAARHGDKKSYAVSRYGFGRGLVSQRAPPPGGIACAFGPQVT
jgi:hypothetical protein